MPRDMMQKRAFPDSSGLINFTCAADQFLLSRFECSEPFDLFYWPRDFPLSCMSFMV